jgi:hypothetical protein
MATWPHTVTSGSEVTPAAAMNVGSSVLVWSSW